MPCKFVDQLSKLRKLSAESVDNTAHFDSFKRYMHIERPVEKELRKLLHSVNKIKGKRLILLCGSAGDGKSHLISYLRNADQGHLLDEYELYNDATESSAPNLTSIDTLAKKLTPFDDEHYLDGDDFRMVLAINLGTLNNFIESEEANRFSALKQYVEVNGIFDGFVWQKPYKPTNVFHHISFSDYQMFTLRREGVGTEYLEALFSKVFCKELGNPFYQAYLANTECTMCQRCPVRHNFDFLSTPKYQKAVIDKIIEITLKDKAIVSTREVLNLLYDIVVHPEFDYKVLCNSASSDVKYLTNYIQYTTPMLLYEYDDISGIINNIRKHDILKERKADMDTAATRFHSLDNIKEAFTEATSETPYAALSQITDISVLGGIKPELKKLVYRFIVRTKEMKGAFPAGSKQARFSAFIQNLYFQNSGKEDQLEQLYDEVQNAIMSWDGHFESDYICIDDSNEYYWILEQLYLDPVLIEHDPIEEDDILRFSTSLKLRFEKANSTNDEVSEINVDYALYEMISAIGEGYRPNVQDKNRHADFVSFIQTVVEFGNKGNRILMVPKNSDNNVKIAFEKKAFKYKFKVV